MIFPVFLASHINLFVDGFLFLMQMLEGCNLGLATIFLIVSHTHSAPLFCLILHLLLIFDFLVGIILLANMRTTYNLQIEKFNFNIFLYQIDLVKLGPFM